MVNREELKRAGLRAYELGRIRAALRAAWVLVPAVFVCAVETGAGENCACLGVLLLSASFYLRWRDRRGADLVHNGLVAGALPFLAGLLVSRVAPSCAGAPLISLCTALCLGAGLTSGVWLGTRLVRDRASGSAWLAASGVAVLAGSLGCVGLGVAGLVGVCLALPLGAASAKLLLRAPA